MVCLEPSPAFSRNAFSGVAGQPRRREAPGLRERANVKASDVRLDRDLPAGSPPEWAQDLEQAVIPGAAGFREVTFFHRPSRTLVLTDLVVNLEAGKLPLHARAFAWATGVLAPGREGARLFTAHR